MLGARIDQVLRDDLNGRAVLRSPVFGLIAGLHVFRAILT